METARCWTERRMHFQMKRCDWISEHIPKPTTSWCKNERKKKYNCENLNRKKSRWTKKYMSRIKIFKYLVLLVWSNKVKKKEDNENDEKCCRGTSRQKETINNQVRRSAGARIGRHVQEWSKMKISAEYFAWLHQCRWYVWRIWTQEFLYFFMKLIRFPLTFLALVYKIGAFFLLVVHEPLHILMKICAHFVRKWSISCRLLRCTCTHKRILMISNIFIWILFRWKWRWAQHSTNGISNIL